jgi:hypothetical protein
MTEMTETYQIPKIPHSKNNGQKYTGGIFCMLRRPTLHTKNLQSERMKYLSFLSFMNSIPR